MVDERTPEEKERLARAVDGLPAWRVLQVMERTVGIKRTAELIGWAVVWGLSGEISGQALRKKLERQGLTYASSYRAISDYKRCADALLELDGYTGPGFLETLRNLAASLA